MLATYQSLLEKSSQCPIAMTTPQPFTDQRGGCSPAHLQAARTTVEHADVGRGVLKLARALNAPAPEASMSQVEGCQALREAAQPALEGNIAEKVHLRAQLAPVESTAGLVHRAVPLVRWGTTSPAQGLQIATTYVLLAGPAMATSHHAWHVLPALIHRQRVRVAQLVLLGKFQYPQQLSHVPSALVVLSHRAARLHAQAAPRVLILEVVG